MSSFAIDTLHYAKRPKAAGFTEEQAEVQAETLADAVSESLVTRSDLNVAVETLRLEMRDLHATLIKWLIPMLLGETAIVAALVKLL